IVLVVILLPLLLCHSLRDCTGNHRALPPFPTRRSSDLEVAEARFYVTAFRIDILPAFAQPVDDLIRLAPGIDGHAAIAGTLGAMEICPVTLGAKARILQLMLLRLQLLHADDIRRFPRHPVEEPLARGCADAIDVDRGDFHCLKSRRRPEAARASG